jgi:outer membrane receptor for ferrienterochelin and colicins
MVDLSAPRHLAATASLFAWAIASPAWADDSDKARSSLTVSGNSLEPTIENGRQIYQGGQFTRFAPQTALDMARQIPGFSITQVSGDRGLGEASQNVLINGQRITGKSNDAETALARIPVSSVVRLEVADASAFNISGISGQVLNAVVREGSLKGNFSYRAEARDRVGSNWRAVEANLSGKLGKGNFTLGANNNGSFQGGSWSEELNRDVDGQLLYARLSEARSRGDRPRLAGSYNLKADNGNILNLNGALELFRFRRNTMFDRFAVGTADIFEIRQSKENEHNYELGGDYEFAFGKGRLKLIGLHRFEHRTSGNEFRRNFTDGAAPAGQRFDQVIDEGENVLRGEYRWQAGTSDWQVSLEGAQNFLDAESEFFTLQNGNYVLQPLPDATSRVEEKRAQSIITYGHAFSGTLSLQATLGGEYSQLSQTGPNGLTRTFWRPKGSIALTWKASPTFAVSSNFQRKVGQLSFGAFLASVDVQNNNNNAGNPLLVPPQSWLWENEANWTLGKSGSVKFKLDGELISDLVDQIPFSPTEEAIGNLSSTAKRLCGEINGSFLLDTVGLRGAKLDLVLALQTAGVRDPVLLTKRPLSNRTRTYWSIDFRHDIPHTQWAWGLSAEDRRDYGFYRPDYFSRYFRNGPFTEVFVEHKDVLGLKVRATLRNLTSQREGSNEIYYLNRRDGPVDFIRDTDFRYGRFYLLTVSGTF